MNKGDKGYVQAVIDQKEYGLTFAQQDFVKKNAKELPLIDLLRKTFKEDSLNEHSLEYDQIRKYVAKVKRNVAPVEFSEEQIMFIENNSHSMKPLELAKNLFPKEKIGPLSKETQTIASYLKSAGISSSPEEGQSDEYRPPKAVASLVRKINQFVPNANWDANDLTPFQRKCIDSLRAYLQSARLIGFFKIIMEPDMKNLLEEEFIKAVHDKSDLNTEELNMYINLCMEYTNIHVQTKAKSLLEFKIANTLDESEDGKKLYMTWIELLGNREADLDKSKKRATDLQIKLSSTRSERQKSLAAINESLSKFIEEFKSEEGRKRAIIVAKANALELENEIARIETAPDYIANIMGIGKDEIIRF